MATIKIIGNSNEALIVTNDEGQVSYVCSKGAWCTHQDEIRWEESMDDAAEYASQHVDRHDDEDVAKVNSIRALPGVQDVTGIDKSAYERLLLLADFSTDIAVPRISGAARWPWKP